MMKNRLAALFFTALAVAGVSAAGPKQKIAGGGINAVRLQRYSLGGRIARAALASAKMLLANTQAYVVVAALPLIWFTPLAAQEAFLTPPLRCGDPNCTFQYLQGAYTPGIINTVLDHSMVKNSNGKWPYIDPNPPPNIYPPLGANGVVEAFNGEKASGLPAGRTPDTIKCIGGTILLRPNATSPGLTNQSGCGAGYTSYDEHPGYDYHAPVKGIPVIAAAAGYVVNGKDDNGKPAPCVLNGIHPDCASWGYIGIDHGNGYITQYGHLSSIAGTLAPGAAVYEGQIVGLSGDTGVPNNPHLHFEVLKQLDPKNNPSCPEATGCLAVDPYGWTGPGGSAGDPLVSGPLADSRYQLNGVTDIKLWADRCDLLTATDDATIPSGYGVAHDVFSPLKKVDLRTACNDTSVTFNVGNGLPTQYIFQTGYEWLNGTWTPITFTGSTPSPQYPGFWIGQAVGTSNNLTLTQLGRDDNYFLAFICTEISDNVFRCGCRDSTCSQSFWQLQRFKQVGAKLWN